jgi:gliding motility-associated-like protein
VIWQRNKPVIKLNREKALRVLIACVLVCCSYLSFAQGTSSQGKEFWTAYMSHIEDNGPSEMSLYVTADEATNVTVEVADGSFSPITQAVVPGQITVVNVPKIVFLKNPGTFLKKGLHITAEKKIAVFAHIYSMSVSGATLLLPVAVLGKSYYSINYTQESNAQGNAFSTFMVVATEDNTTVEITPSQPLTDGQAAGATFILNLNKGDVYQGFSFKDLTNTQIRSVSSANGECKKIAVFSGSTKIGIGCQDDIGNHFTSDNLFQQVYPTTSWGKTYITVPLKNRNYDIFRVVFSDPNTQLTINGNVIPKTSFQTPFYYQFEAQATKYITADKPIQVVQYAVSQGKTPGNDCVYDTHDVGDPEMIYLNPLEQTLDHVTLYSAREFKILSNYVNVVIKTDMASTFKVDGMPYTDFSTIANNPIYSYAQISLTAGSHTLNASDGFSAIAYGFGSNESYGYSAGTNLKNLNENIVFTPLQGTGTQVDGCTDEQYKLRLTLPFRPTKIVWDFKGLLQNYTDPNPVMTGMVAGGNGQTVYLYEYKDPVSFSAGDHTITATATNPVADECGTDVDVDFDFNIGERPRTRFAPDGIFCTANMSSIIDQTTGNANSVKIWWDYQNHPEAFDIFSKSMIPADRKYHHQYETLTIDKTYLIHMETFSGATSQCGDPFEQTVTVHVSPIASFDAVTPLCQDAVPVQLIPHHEGFTGPDGVFSGAGVTAGGKFDPAVSGAGKFTITYTFTATNLCPVVFSRDIVVNPLPIVNAGKYIQLLEGEPVLLPATASGSGLTYLWEPAIGLDNPNVLNPVCSVAEDTRYKLTVTTAAGCIAYDDIFVKVLKKPIVVNAFTPNGDGINDTWTIKYLDTYPGNTVDIYNRQGERVYSSVGYASPWDGRFNGKVLPTGTYYYIINPKNGRKVISGNVTIIK